MGSVTVNVTVSSRLSPVSEPPWSCVICRAMARPSPRAAGRGARRVQPVELLKNARELFRRDRVAAIPEADNGELPTRSAVTVISVPG